MILGLDDALTRESKVINKNKKTYLHAVVDLVLVFTKIESGDNK